MAIPEGLESSEATRCRRSDAGAPTISPDLTGPRRVGQLTVPEDMLTRRSLPKIAALGGQRDIWTGPNVIFRDNCASFVRKRMGFAAAAFAQAAYDWLGFGPEAVAGLKITGCAKFSLRTGHSCHLTGAVEGRASA